MTTLEANLVAHLNAAPTLRDEDKVLPWFYRTLNNTLTDLYRRRGVEARYQPVLVQEHDATVEL